jgi:hypothetical protein
MTRLDAVAYFTRPPIVATCMLYSSSRFAVSYFPSTYSYNFKNIKDNVDFVEKPVEIQTIATG